MRRPAVALFVVSCCSGLMAQDPDSAQLLEALARSAAIFARSAPDLTARETLSQRGRRGDMQILKSGPNAELKKIAFTLPDVFQTHEVVSQYSFGQVGDTPGFHEVRRIVSVDGEPVTGEARHALTIGTASAEDETKKRLLEDLEHTQLQGSAVDFGLMMLLFTKGKQGDFELSGAGRKTVESGTVFVLQYRQISGDTGLTEFRDKRQNKHPFSGQIWLRDSDLVPTRITVNTEAKLTSKYTLRNEAEIDYQPTPYGMAPAMVLHRQFLNRDLLVENHFRYADYHGLTVLP